MKQIRVDDGRSVQKLLEMSGLCPTTNLFGTQLPQSFAQMGGLNKVELMNKLEEHRNNMKN